MDSPTTGTSTRDPGSLQQIGSCLLGMLVGLALLVLGLGLLARNEGQVVQAFESLNEGLKIVVSLKNIDVVNRENNGKLVHLVGPLSTDKAVHYEHYGVSVHAVKLKSIEEMYQWVEHEDRIEYYKDYSKLVETTYSYSKEWRSDVINCSSFHETFNHKHVYPTRLLSNPLRIIEAFNVHVGQFGLSKGLISRISEFHPLPPSYLHPPQDSYMVLHDGAFYRKDHYRDPLHPKIGDLRTRLEYAGISGESLLGSPAMVTIVAKQFGSELVPYKTLEGDELEMLYYGQFSPKEIFDMEIFKKEKNHNTVLTWGIRFGGFLLVFFGSSLLGRDGDWIPIANACIVSGENLMSQASIFSEHVAMGVNYMNLMTLLFSIGISSFYIGLSIIIYRPLLGVCMMLICICSFALFCTVTRKPKDD